jgi:nitrite reductase (NADH) small subunit
MTGPQWPESGPPGARYEAHAVGRVEEFVTGQFRIVEIGSRSIGVVRTIAGWYAIRNRCPHQGAPLCRGRTGGTMLPAGVDEYRFGLNGRVVKCPWHGWEFSLETGRSLFDVSPARTAVYPVEVVGDEVRVLLRSRESREPAPTPAQGRTIPPDPGAPGRGPRLLDS